MLNAIAKPFGVLLLWLYEWLGNYGLAIILFAIIVKLILMPFMLKSKKSSLRMTRLNPRVNELKKRYASNQQKMNEEIQKLYREENVKPLGGCIWTIIPFPILLALYQAIRFPITIMMGVDSALLAEGGALSVRLAEAGFNSSANAAYIQISQAQFISNHFSQFSDISDKLRQVDFSFLSMNLGDTPSYKFLWTTDWSNSEIWLPGLLMFLIPILGGLLTYLSSKVSMQLTNQGAAPDQSQQMMKNMNIIMPVVTIWFSFVMPAALGLYWIVGMVYTLVQDYITNKVLGKRLAAEQAEFMEREHAREAELEAKRKETERLKAENATVVNPNTSKEKLREQERKERAEKAAEWERKRAAERGEPVRRSAVGDRPYARGRAFMEERYESAAAEETAPSAEEPTPVPTVSEPSPRAVEAPAPAPEAEEDEVYESEDFYGEDESEDAENK